MTSEQGEMPMTSKPEIEIEEYIHPVERYHKEVKGEKWLAVFIDSEFLIVATDERDGVIRGTWSVPKKYATELIADFDQFSQMLAGMYFAGWFSVRDIAYEKVGDPLVPLWERFLHSLGFACD